MRKPKCPICDTSHERMPQAIFESSYWRATLSANQGYLGTLFVELLDHKETLGQLSRDEWLDFSELVASAEHSVKQAFDAVTFNWSSYMNNFYRSFHTSPHVYWHMRPRYDRDVIVNDRILIDPNFGEQYDRTHMVHVSPELKEAIASRIRAGMARD